MASPGFERGSSSYVMTNYTTTASEATTSTAAMLFHPVSTNTTANTVVSFFPTTPIKNPNHHRNLYTSLGFNSSFLSLTPPHSHQGGGLARFSALKKRRKSGRSGTSFLGASDDEEVGIEDGDEFDGFLSDVDAENDVAMFLPFGKMKRWLENKPRGFGEGKVYDTCIEDKLLEEISQSQAANINNNNCYSPSSKSKSNEKSESGAVVRSGFRVHVLNLPKKKNVHRDLKLAFKDVPGVLDIVPAVSGNKKTKDPICKGLAYVDFTSQDAAAWFVKQFSGQTIAFGKIQKEIRCKMTDPNSSSSNDGDEHVKTESFQSSTQSKATTMEGDFDLETEVDDSVFEEDGLGDLDNQDERVLEAEWEDVTEKLESFSISESGGSSSIEPVEPANSSSSLKKKTKKLVTKKKIAAKGKKSEKVPKLVMAGSAKRLKIKEKAMLTDVLSKYSGAQTALASPAREE